MGEIRAGVPFSIRVCLKENSSRGILGGICGDGKWFVEVGGRKDWLFQEFFLELVKGFLTGRSPFPLLVFLCQVNEWVGYAGEIANESLIIIGKS